MKKYIVMLVMAIVILLILLLNVVKHKNIIKSDIQNVDNKKEFNIVTSFYPIYLAVLNITEGATNVSVKNLTPTATGCLHNYTLLPEEMILLAKADVLVINGGGMEGFLSNVIREYPTLDVVDSSKNIKYLKNKIGKNEEINPHFFMSIEEYITQIQNISKALENKNTTNAEKYKENTKTYIEKLENIKKEMSLKISLLKNKNIAVFDDAFEYFTKEFKLNVLVKIETEHEAQITAIKIATAIKEIKDKNITCIFAAPDVDTKITDTIFKETGVKTYILNPVTFGRINKDIYRNARRKLENNSRYIKIKDV